MLQINLFGTNFLLKLYSIGSMYLLNIYLSFITYTYKETSPISIPLLLYYSIALKFMLCLEILYRIYRIGVERHFVLKGNVTQYDRSVSGESLYTLFLHGSLRFFLYILPPSFLFLFHNHTRTRT